MNKAKIIALLQDGAYFDSRECKFHHPSFRKGWRKMTSGNISWQAVDRALGIWGTKQLVEQDRVYKLASI